MNTLAFDSSANLYIGGLGYFYGIGWIPMKYFNGDPYLDENILKEKADTTYSEIGSSKTFGSNPKNAMAIDNEGNLFIGGDFSVV